METITPRLFKIAVRVLLGLFTSSARYFTLAPPPPFPQVGLSDTVFSLIVKPTGQYQWLFSGDGTETRHEYTEFVCATSPSLYQLSHYLFDEYDMNGDHHLRKDDYDNLFLTMDTDSKLPAVVFGETTVSSVIRCRFLF